MANSKDVFKSIMEDVEEFKSEGEAWCNSDDARAVGKARSYAKRIMKKMRVFTQLSIEEAVSVIPEVITTTVVEEVVEEEEKDVETYNNPYPEV